ncbi:hypothetical protein ACWDUC_38600 [Streptomyces tricolor]
MNSLIVCVRRGVIIEQVCEQLLSAGIAAELNDGRVAVSHLDSQAWIAPDLEGELQKEYDPDELTLIGRLIGEWQGFIIDYRSLQVAEAAAAVISERWPCVLDDENGFLGLAQEYFQRRRHGGSTDQ